MKALFDTNILIDYLNGIGAAKDEIARFEHPLISVVGRVRRAPIRSAIPH